MTISRRHLLKYGTGAAAACAAGLRPGTAAAPRKIPVALQLYSVREACAKDLPRVLEAVAKMGYEGVEFAGYHGRSAAALRKLLDVNGVKCCGTHIGLNDLQGDALKRTVEFNQTTGNRFLIVSWMPDAYSKSLQTVKDTARVFSEIAAKIKDGGLRVGYHAHGGDFQKIDGQTAWDLLFTHASADVTMQMDIGNCLEAGGDPYATLKNFPGRSATVHLKEYGGPAAAVVGEGQVRWPEVFQVCQTTGGTEWYIVEHERAAGDPLDNVKRCLHNVRKLLA